MSKKYLLVVPGYPSEKNRYNNGFVHTRVRIYLRSGLNVDIFSVSKMYKLKYYSYDNVQVIEGNYENLAKQLQHENYNRILVHFAFKRIMEVIMKNVPNTPIIIWIHGVEALAWYRRLFNIEISKLKSFIRYIILNVRQMIFLSKYINSVGEKTLFVFVSEWMKKILEKDTFGKIKNYVIIPNVIDESIFSYMQKKPQDRLKILSIRPYTSRKYANDKMVSTILLLSKKNYFSELSFTLYGEGRLFNKTVAPLRKFLNVEIHNKMLTHEEIAQLHSNHGVILIPTRQDAQGVSMCEAMSSGLVPVASNNTAIPEYLPDNCGYKEKTVQGMVEAIENMYLNPELFLIMSKNSSEFIRHKCSNKVVIDKEIGLITGLDD